MLLRKWFKYLDEELFTECKSHKGWDVVIENFNNKDIVYLPINNSNIIN